MGKITGKRFGAFLIDSLIVMFIASMFASLPILNPYLKEYNETYEKYMDLYTSQLLGDVDKEGRNEVENKEGIKEDSNNVEDTKNDDVVLEDDTTSEEKTDEEINEELSLLNYNMTKYGMPTSIIQLVVTILYFVVFQYFNGGKTIGKALLKINVVSLDGKLKFSQVLIRSVIINSIATLMLSISLFYIFNKDLYMNLASYVQLLDLTLLFVSFGMMMFRLDGRGLHDMLANTNVVKIGDITKEAKIKEKK